MRFHLLAFAFVLTLAGTAAAHSPRPPSLRGMLAEPASTSDRQCEDDTDPKCVKRTYNITINVNEKLVRLPLAQQTPRVLGYVKWFVEEFAESFPDNEKTHDVSFVFYGALNGKVIGWADGNEWIWDREYVDAVNRRALR